MRQLSRRLLLLANICAGNLAALFLLALFISPGFFSQDSAEQFDLVIDIRSSTAIQFACLASVLLILINVLYLLYWRRPQNPMRYVLSEAPGGPLMVSKDALETGLRSQGETVPDVTRLRVTIKAGALKRIRLHARFHCPEGAEIRELSRKLRTTLEERFATLVKLTEGAKLVTEIEFCGFAGKLARRPVEKEVVAAESGPFTGPKYPIDDEDPYQAKADS